MWLMADYEAVTLFSLKMSGATSSGGKSLLLPTPYAIKLLVDAIPRLGSGVGKVSGISTLGAILGTLGTAFYLVAWMGTRHLFRLNGLILLCLGLLLTVADARSRRHGRKHAARRETA